MLRTHVPAKVQAEKATIAGAASSTKAARATLSNKHKQVAK